MAACAAVLLTLYGAGSLWRTRDFLREGRGHYLDAVRLIAAQSGHETTVGSGHDFAHAMLVEFYAAYVPQTRLRYLWRKDWTRDQPEWAIVHQDRRNVVPEPTLTAATGTRYRFVQDFRSSEHVGWDWFIYRREAPGAGQ